MGTFLTPGKNEYFWRLISGLSPDTYATDRDVLAYTPAAAQTYVAFFPDLYSPYPATTLYLYINKRLAATGVINDASGFFYVSVLVPKGQFSVEIRDSNGSLVKQEFYNSKNFAFLFDIAAQSYEDRRVALEQAKNDISFDTIRTERLPSVVGDFFGFPPPPGWDSTWYREALLGGCGSGFVKSFFHGATKKGILDTVKSITCLDAQITPGTADGAWVLFDAASAPDPTDPVSSDAWFVSDVDLPPNNKRIVILDQYHYDNGFVLTVNGASRSVSEEVVYKRSNSYIEGKLQAPFVLAGTDFSFSIDGVTYKTVFVSATTSAQVVSEILGQNPTLDTDALYEADGRIRIGAQPEAGKDKVLTILPGMAADLLGFVVGDSITISPDTLANPWAYDPIILVYGPYTYVRGSDYEYMEETGEIVWKASSSFYQNVPPAGSSYLATYSYQMRREIIDMVEKVKDAISVIDYVWN